MLTRAALTVEARLGGGALGRRVVVVVVLVLRRLLGTGHGGAASAAAAGKPLGSGQQQAGTRSAPATPPPSTAQAQLGSPAPANRAGAGTPCASWHETAHVLCHPVTPGQAPGSMQALIGRSLTAHASHGVRDNTPSSDTNRQEKGEGAGLRPRLSALGPGAVFSLQGGYRPEQCKAQGKRKRFLEITPVLCKRKTRLFLFFNLKEKKNSAKQNSRHVPRGPAPLKSM